MKHWDWEWIYHFLRLAPPNEKFIHPSSTSEPHSESSAPGKTEEFGAFNGIETDGISVVINCTCN